MSSTQFLKYQEQYINTLTPEELVTLLYNEVTKRLNKAIAAIENKQLLEAHNCLVKSQDIILHLMSTLDLSIPISNQLMPLYDFMYNTLVKANVHKDIESIKIVLKMVGELKETWVEAININRHGSTALGKSV